MAVALNSVKAAQFKDIFESPTIEKILQLSPSDAEKFVLYVFESAGFVATDVHSVHFPEGPGVDLTLHNPRDPDVVQHGVEVKRWASPVGPAPVQAFGWQLHQKHISGYFVAVGGFTPAARTVAAEDSSIILVDGEHLLRFITYLGRSRVDRAYTSIQLPLAEPAGPEWMLRADALVKLSASPPHRAHILALANNKGGVGKSTSARCLGLSLAKKNQRVLFIDMDAQTNLTDSLLPDYTESDVHPNLAGYFAGAYPLSDAIIEIPQQKPYGLIPGHIDLGTLDMGGAGHPAVELQFVADLYSLALSRGPHVPKGFSWIILDTPPAVSLYTRAALAAADLVIAPARARASSSRGTLNALHARHAMNALMGRAGVKLGSVVTHWQNDRQSVPKVDLLQLQLLGRGGHMFTARIPWSAAIETPQPPYAVRQAYDALLEEVLRDVSIS
jgi:cellulose biosynthesis protein BcsQ